MSRVKKEAYDKWYDRSLWRNKLRPMVLARDPLCCMCLLNGDTPPKPSTVVDHKISHLGNWDLFTDLKNLWGICKQHHDEKTATENYGFGNASRKYVPQRRIAHTGATGPQFISGSLQQWQLDKALGSKEALDELIQFAKSEVAEPKAETE